jgi:hypothetical protein
MTTRLPQLTSQGLPWTRQLRIPEPRSQGTVELAARNGDAMVYVWPCGGAGSPW